MCPFGRAGGGGRFAPDLYGAVIGGGGEDGAVFGVGLGGYMLNWGLGRRVGREERRTHETHQTAPSCLEKGQYDTCLVKMHIV